MPAQDVPSTGKDTSIQLLVDGVPMRLLSQITNFTADAVYDMIETKLLGSSGRKLDKEFTGWKGSLDISTADGQLDDFIDAYNFNVQNRIPQLVNIISVTRFRDGTSRTHVYPQVEVDWGVKVRRGEARIVTLGWETGLDRF